MNGPAILATAPAVGERPSVTYRPAGDRAILVEYGEEELDLRLNFFVLSVLARLRRAPPPGLVGAAPGLRSMLISFAPGETDRAALIERLRGVHENAPFSGTIPSRLITLPIAFDDSASTKAVQRYAATIRPDAPNTEGGTNIDYIVRSNGLPDREAVFAAVLATDWWTAFTGFSPGLPFMFPLDLRHEMSVPKYNPTRAWTPEGAVGMGGPCVAIYPVESPGSFQLFGRTLPIHDILGRHHAFAAEANLIRPGDRVRFTRVSENELLALRRQVFENRYEYHVTDESFEVSDYLAERERNADAVTACRQRRAEAAAHTEVP